MARQNPAERASMRDIFASVDTTGMTAAEKKTILDEQKRKAKVRVATSPWSETIKKKLKRKNVPGKVGERPKKKPM